MTISVCHAIEIFTLRFSQPIIELCCLEFAAFKWGSYLSDMVWSGRNCHLFSSFPPLHHIWFNCSIFFFSLEACGCSILYTPLTKSVAHLFSWFIIMFRMNCKDTSVPAIIHSWVRPIPGIFPFWCSWEISKACGGWGDLACCVWI